MLLLFAATAAAAPGHAGSSNVKGIHHCNQISNCMLLHCTFSTTSALDCAMCCSQKRGEGSCSVGKAQLISWLWHMTEQAKQQMEMGHGFSANTQTDVCNHCFVLSQKHLQLW